MYNNLKWPRILVAIAALMLAGAMFLPIWRIELSAPQYPEGLTLQIFAKGLAGDVDIVNGLNHYIGMHLLHSKDFIEFTLLPYILGVVVLLGLLAVYVNKKKFYYAFIVLFMFVAIISMVDFYRWEYNYGHNLDPNAAIQVPGMFYQPPLIGYKQLLNFGAYSVPDIGGWLFIGAGVLLFIAYLIILQPKWLPFKKRNIAVATLLLMFSIQSCSQGPQPIKYGSEACDFCKMTIMDKKFACEWVTDKGKVYRFDDIHCLLSFRKADNSKGTAYINDFTVNKEFTKAANLYYVKSDELKTPMNGNVAAFLNEASQGDFLNGHSGKKLSWSEAEKETVK
jgi:copper chaperone NosL